MSSPFLVLIVRFSELIAPLRRSEDYHANVLPRRGALAGMRIAETGQEDGPLAAGIYDLPLGMASRALYLDNSNSN